MSFTKTRPRPGQIIGYRRNGLPIRTVAGAADVVLDTSEESIADTFAHVNSNADNAIIVCMQSGEDAENHITGVTYGGVSLDYMGWQLAGEESAGGIVFYGKIGGLPTGSNNVVVSGFDNWAGAATYENADSFGTLATYVADTYADAAITVHDTVDGGAVFAAACGGSANAGDDHPLAVSPAVYLWYVQANNGSAAGNGWAFTEDSAGGGADTTVAWTYGTVDDWTGMLAVEIRPASGGGGGVTVSGAVNLKKIVLSGSSAEESGITSAIKLKKIKLSGASTEHDVVTSAIKLKKVVLSGASAEKSVVTGAINLKKVVLSASSTEHDVVTSAIKLKKIKLSGASSELSVAEMAIILKKIVLSGSSAESSVTTSAIVLKKLIFQANSEKHAQVTAAIKLKKIVLSGTSAEESVTTSAIKLKKIKLSGASTEQSAVTSAIKLKKLVFQASSVKHAEITGALHLKKLVLSGASSEESVTVSALKLKKLVLSGASHELAAGSSALVLKKLHFHGQGSSGGPTAQDSALFIFSPL